MRGAYLRCETLTQLAGAMASVGLLPEYGMSTLVGDSGSCHLFIDDNVL